jgi:hypothetical protein
MNGKEIDGRVITLVDKDGEYEMVTGERAKCGMRDKWMFFEALKDSQSAKQLLRIVGLKIPVSFDNKTYDDSQPSHTPHPQENSIVKKAIKEAKEAFGASIEVYEEKLVEEYQLNEPTVMAILGLIDILLDHHRRTSHKELDFNDMKISPQLASTLEMIMRYHEADRAEADMTTNSDFVLDRKNLFGDDSMTTAGDIIKAIMSQVPLKLEKWKAPALDKTFEKYPCVCKLILPAITAAVANEREAVASKDLSDVEAVREYVRGMLAIEKILLPHLERVERYYARCAENITKISTAIKKMIE